MFCWYGAHYTMGKVIRIGRSITGFSLLVVVKWLIYWPQNIILGVNPCLLDLAGRELCNLTSARRQLVELEGKGKGRPWNYNTSSILLPVFISKSYGFWFSIKYALKKILSSKLHQAHVYKQHKLLAYLNICNHDSKSFMYSKFVQPTHQHLKKSLIFDWLSKLELLTRYIFPSGLQGQGIGNVNI